MVFGRDAAVSYTALDSRQQSPPEGHQLATSGNTDHGWRPSWARRSVLLAFLSCFAAMLGALEVLNVFSIRHDGLASTNMSYHYLWTYGPTAVLTLFLALWNRVDYRVRQMAPWIAMHENSSVPASRSVFLDYITPTMPEILWHSLANRHFAVTASTLVANLVTILIVVSTSLLSLVPRPATLTDVPYQTTLKFIDNGTAILSSTSTLPANIIDAIDTLNLSYPFGTTPQHAYQPFELLANDISGNSIRQAPVEVLVFDLDCEEAQLDSGFWSYSWMWSPCYSNTSTSNGPSLNASMNATVNNCTMSPNHFYEYGNNGDVGNFATFKYDNCDEGIYSDNKDVRMLFMFGEARQNGEVGPSPSQSGCPDEAPTADIEILRSKQWICSHRLSSLPGNITFNSTDLSRGGLPQISLDETTERGDFDNISNWYLLSQITTISLADFTGGQKIPIKGIPEAQGAEMRTLRSVGPDRLEDLLTTDLYLDLSVAYSKQALSMVTHFELTQRDNTTVQGTATIIGDRLLVRTTPLRAMEALLGSIVILILYLIIGLSKISVTPCDPAQLVGLAEILVQNPHIARSFSRSGSLQLTALQQVYGSDSYKSLFIQELGDTFSGPGSLRFALEQTSPTTQSQQPSLDGSLRWWRPLTVALLSRITISCIVVALVVALQVLLILSNRAQGLAAVSPSGAESLSWSILPAFVMASIAMYVRAVNTIYKGIAPYCLLCSGSDARRTLSRNYLSMTEIEVLLHTLRDRQIAVFLMTFATMLAAFLTVAVSGVFTVLPVASNLDATLSQQSWFINNGSDDNGTVGNSGSISGLILTSNLSYPQWTYGNLALASFGIDRDLDRALSNNVDSRFRGTIPAIRTALNCTVYDQEDIGGLEYIDALGGPNKKGILANKLGRGEACTGNSSEVESLTGASSGGGFYWTGVLNNTNEGCPLLNFYWGYQGPTGGSSETDNVTYAKGLACYETTEQLDVNVTLVYPDLQVDTQEPPVPLEDTAKLFTKAITTLSYSAMPAQSASGQFGETFWDAVKTRFGLADEDLGDPDQVQRIVGAIEYSQGIVRAQQYHVALRTADVAASAVDSFTSVVGVVTDSGTYRLFLNRAATGVLSGLLASILICTAISGWLMSTKKVLPKNPFSIGAMISLLADSNLLEKKAPAVRKQSRGTKTSVSPMSRSSMVKMGWCSVGHEEERVFTIHVIDDEIPRAEEHDTSSSIPLRSLSSPNRATRKGFTRLNS